MAYRKETRGRKLKYKDVRKLNKRIEEYFAYCDPHLAERPVVIPLIKEWRGGKEGKEIVRPPKKNEWPNFYDEGRQKYITEQRPYTITGLAVFLDTCRDTLLNYQKNDLFFDTITRAKERIHNYAEGSLYTVKNPSGVVFNLKNNHGWVDKHEFAETLPATGYEDMTPEELEKKRIELEHELYKTKRKI